MKQVLLFILFSCCFSIAYATHIVGGGFTYKQVATSTYQFQLTLYFDDINGNPGALDESLTCYFFRKSDNQLMDSLFMPLVQSNQLVPYSNPLCALGSGVSTRILLYRNNIFLSDSRYNSPAGYYVAWERCCRNEAIVNIINPGASGQTFYMEFPPVIKNGQSYTNGAPVFQPIVADYPCIGKPFSLSFAATDPDGDSLSYEMVVPLKGNSTTSQPANLSAKPAPYALIDWKPGYSATNALPGNPALQVNPLTGILACTPNQIGLFVFSVRCVEYRNGLQIGEVRRDMQLFVKDCFPNTPPVIDLPNPELAGVSFADNDTLTILSGLSQACKSLKMTDLQRNQQLIFRIITLTPETPSFLAKPAVTLSFSPGQDSLTTNFCIPACTSTPANAVWKVGIVVTDNGCPEPKSDTLQLFVKSEIMPLQKPFIGIETGIPDTIRIVQTEILSIPITAFQSEGSPLQIRSTFTDTLGTSLPVTNIGIKLPSGSGLGVVESAWQWPEICLIPENQPIMLTSIATATGCGNTRSDTLIKWLYVEPKDLAIQILSSFDGDGPIKLLENQTLDFNITGNVTENRVLSLTATGSLTGIPGIAFSPKTGNGVVSSPFNFSTNCSTPPGPHQIEFKTSSIFCGKSYSDSIMYEVSVDFSGDTLGIIPNLITVNGDQKNDVLAVADILAKDNCRYQFDFIEIFNRWGNLIHKSEDHNFVWKPASGEEGIYFFAIHFAEKTFRDWILVVR